MVVVVVDRRSRLKGSSAPCKVKGRNDAGFKMLAERRLGSAERVSFTVFFVITSWDRIETADQNLQQALVGTLPHNPSCLSINQASKQATPQAREFRRRPSNVKAIPERGQVRAAASRQASRARARES